MSQDTGLGIKYALVVVPLNTGGEAHNVIEHSKRSGMYLYRRVGMDNETPRFIWVSRQGGFTLVARRISLPPDATNANDDTILNESLPIPKHMFVYAPTT